MQFSVISSVLVVAVVAIGTIDASPSPIRIVTPKPGIDYKIRTVRPDTRIRYLRAIDEGDQLVQADPVVDTDFDGERRIVRSIGEDSEVQAEDVDLLHISKRSPERIVINYKPPPANGPRHARSAIGDSK